MPRLITNYDGSNSIYYEKNELPRNVQKFMREIDKENFTIKDVTYEIRNPAPDDEDPEIVDDLTIYTTVDAEFAAKNLQTGHRLGRDFEIKYESTAKALGIDNFYIFAEFTNKKEFADKFLKKLKVYLKTTEVAKHIHSIRFDLKSVRNMELVITKKRDSWNVNDRVIKEVVKEYLSSIGYPNIHITIP